ncbi:MAG: helix-turn-helix transcriptional regulator [Eubacteriales bacterium]|nr:helix-turn-helix transcriptional regulator [Eubacteriales bacterium]
MLGKNIRKLRRDRDLSQEQLAEALEVSRFAIQRWEAGTNTPRAETLERIAEYFDTTSYALMKEERTV